MGGDEFIAFLNNIADEKILKSKAMFLNEEILNTARQLLGEEMKIPLGASIGAVFVPREGTDFATLYKKADKALYDVKHNGKHNLTVFGEKNLAENNSIGELSQMRLILGERNIDSGAYFVDFEAFKHIYRMLIRTDNSQKGLTLVQFTLNDDSAEEFKEILIHALRKSDCVTRNGNKFLVLLQGGTEIAAEIVKSRIFSRTNGIEDKIFFKCEKIK